MAKPTVDIRKDRIQLLPLSPLPMNKSCNCVRWNSSERLRKYGETPCPDNNGAGTNLTEARSALPSLAPLALSELTP